MTLILVTNSTYNSISWEGDIFQASEEKKGFITVVTRARQLRNEVHAFYLQEGVERWTMRLQIIETYLSRLDQWLSSHNGRP